MNAMLLSAGFVFGSLLQAIAADPLAAVSEARPPVLLEVTVSDPELEQMARDLEREVFPLLPKGTAQLTRR